MQRDANMMRLVRETIGNGGMADLLDSRECMAIEVPDVHQAISRGSKGQTVWHPLLYEVAEDF